MKPSKKLVAYLEKLHIPYELCEHKTTYTAYDTAATLRIPLQSAAKSLCVKSDKGFFLILLPASCRVDMTKLAKNVKGKKISIPSEKDLTRFLKNNLTKSPLLPLGIFYSLPTYFDARLLKSKKIVIGSGSFSHSLCIASKELKKIPNCFQGNFSTQIPVTKPKNKVKKKVKKVKRKGKRV